MKDNERLFEQIKINVTVIITSFVFYLAKNTSASVLCVKSIVVGLIGWIQMKTNQYAAKNRVDNKKKLDSFFIIMSTTRKQARPNRPITNCGIATRWAAYL